jgi:hypothetical protein
MAHPMEVEPRRSRPLVPIAIGVAVLLVAAVVAVLAAGDDGKGGGGLALVSKAGAAALSKETARFELESRTTGGGVNLTITGSGHIDLKTGAGTFDLTTSGRKVHTLSDGKTAWLRMEGLEQVTPGGKPWVAVDAEEARAQGGGSGADQLGYLQGLSASSGVRRVGEQDIRGEHTTHYKLDLDVAELQARVPEGLRQSIAPLRAAGLTTVPAEVWLDDDGLPVRYVIRFDISGVTSTTTMDFSDFGSRVSVDPPPAGDVYTASSAAELGSLVASAATR